MTRNQILKLGYFEAKQLENGTWIALQKMLYTTGLTITVDETGYKRRYCYESATQAYIALVEWDGNGDPPGLWIKEKPSDRMNSKWLE